MLVVQNHSTLGELGLIREIRCLSFASERLEAELARVEKWVGNDGFTVGRRHIEVHIVEGIHREGVRRIRKQSGDHAFELPSFVLLEENENAENRLFEEQHLEWKERGVRYRGSGFITHDEQTLCV